MWSYAKHDLKLTDAEFFALTPRQFSHLSQRHRYEREHQEFLFGQLTAWVANCGFKSPKESVKPRDFMPSMFGREEKPVQQVKLKRRKRSSIAFELRSTMAHFMRSQ